MKVVPPIQIGVASLYSTNVAVPTSSTAWVSATSYVTNDRVLVTSNNSVYRCIRDTVPNIETVSPSVNSLEKAPYWVNEGPKAWVSGTTYTPGQITTRVSTGRNYICLLSTGPVSTTAPENLLVGVTVYWADVGASNIMSMFELQRNVTTKATIDGGASIVVEVTLGERADTLALTGLKNASRYRFQVYADETKAMLLYDSDYISLPGREVVSWYEYFFLPMRSKPTTVLSTFITPTTSHIVITIEGSNVECAGVVLGVGQELGPVQRGASNDATNFSKIERDVFGNATLVPRRSVPKTTQTLLVDASRLNTIRRIRDDLNAKVALWIGLQDEEEQPYFDSLLILGVYKQFSFTLDNPAYPILQLELEEI